MASLVQPRTGRSVTLILAAALPVIATLVSGQLATFPNLTPWYAGLAKPTFNPPDAVFGPVWTALYMLMAYAVWRVLRLPAGTAGRTRALVAFYVQLALNAAWSFAFFAAHSPLLGLVVIVPLLVMILVTITAFFPIDRIAAESLIPYAAWVAFATVLNASIWWLNR